MITIHLYGDLRQYGDDPRPDRESVRRVPAAPELTVSRVLEQTGIPADQVAQIFLNGRLLRTVNSMAPWLGYQTASERLPAGGGALEVHVRSGDRLGLFPHRMAMLVV